MLSRKEAYVHIIDRDDTATVANFGACHSEEDDKDMPESKSKAPKPEYDLLCGGKTYSAVPGK
jgi:hypothetical protein